MTYFPGCFLVWFGRGARNRSAEFLPRHEEDSRDWLDYDPYSVTASASGENRSRKDSSAPSKRLRMQPIDECDIKRRTR